MSKFTEGFRIGCGYAAIFLWLAWAVYAPYAPMWFVRFAFFALAVEALLDATKRRQRRKLAALDEALVRAAQVFVNSRKEKREQGSIVFPVTDPKVEEMN